MPRTPSSAFLRRKAEPQSAPIELWDIHLGSTTTVDSNTVFFAVTNRALEFFSYVDGTPKTFNSLGIGRSPIARHIDSKIDSVSLSLDNVDRTLSQYFLNLDLRGKRIIIRKVFADYLASPADGDGNNFVVMFDGVLDAPALNQSKFTAQARNNFFQSLAFNIPRRTYQGVCNWRFGHTGDCAAHLNQTQLFDTKTAQTIDSTPSQVHLTDGARSEGASGDYWAPGIIQMTGGTAGNIGVKRRIIQSTATGDLYLESNFPFVVVAGDQYTIQRDCDHTLQNCTDRFQNNSEYGGFISIPDMLVRRA
jgi:phage-related protein